MPLSSPGFLPWFSRFGVVCSRLVFPVSVQLQPQEGSGLCWDGFGVLVDPGVLDAGGISPRCCAREGEKSWGRSGLPSKFNILYIDFI